jgi:hypothetical protein
MRDSNLRSVGQNRLRVLDVDLFGLTIRLSPESGRWPQAVYGPSSDARLCGFAARKPPFNLRTQPQTPLEDAWHISSALPGFFRLYASSGLVTFPRVDGNPVHFPRLAAVIRKRLLEMNLCG